MNFTEYRNSNIAYILVNNNGMAVKRGGTPFISEAPSASRAKANILHRMRQMVKSTVEWDVINNPADYVVVPYTEWKAKQPVKFEPLPVEEPDTKKPTPKQGEMFNVNRWH